jgi:Tfp pilus assembly protein PilF
MQVVNNYGPLLYRNLGFDNATQLLYGAAWLTFALGLNSKSPADYIHTEDS